MVGDLDKRRVVEDHMVAMLSSWRSLYVIRAAWRRVYGSKLLPKDLCIAFGFGATIRGMAS